MARASEIIAITGSSASGKDSAAEHIAAEHGYLHVDTGDIVRKAGIERYGSEDQYVLRKVGHEIRQELGQGGLGRMALDLYLQSKDAHHGLVVSGIRAVPAAMVIKESGGFLLYVDAPTEVRFDRLVLRGKHGESSTLEEFIQYEREEYEGNLSTGQNLEGVRALCDYYLFNDYPDVETYLATVESVLGFAGDNLAND